ncbi:uncharacterized protein MELLADRAFT_105763 [Melampsora larici-populina 98AG31]|uniref:Uncharacterized protein n=1 Tax=Melampsora larici-populina (strain 98AG31 / pathotype 3-4-7) TaxID=747676 RepID=F4RJ89_MELLP|nr:uncharacterized protein MELLADRAFT_105763 [Melampsora larici-populina 98AG31]EGG07278.1 hypothetical protein MELLADRAFT_105763 [Melampsora larici-populina 98AG31]
MESAQKEKLVAAKNKLHQMHLESEEKKKIQAEKERIQAQERAKRAGSRAPQSSHQQSGTPVGPPLVGKLNNSNTDNDGIPIGQPDEDEGLGVAGHEGDDESSEAEGITSDFRSTLKKNKAHLLEDGSQAPSLKRSIRIKGREAAIGAILAQRKIGFTHFASSNGIPSTEEKDDSTKQGVSIMDKLNHAVEFGTIEEARAALEKVDAVLKRTLHFDLPRRLP